MGRVTQIDFFRVRYGRYPSAKMQYEFVGTSRVKISVNGNETTIGYIPIAWIRALQVIIGCGELRNYIATDRECPLSLTAHVWMDVPFLTLGGIRIPLGRGTTSLLEELVVAMIDMRQTFACNESYKAISEETLEFTLRESQVCIGYVTGFCGPRWVARFPLEVMKIAFQEVNYEWWWGPSKMSKTAELRKLNGLVRLVATTSGMVAVSFQVGDNIEALHFTAKEFVQVAKYLKLPQEEINRIELATIWKPTCEYA